MKMNKKKILSILAFLIMLIIGCIVAAMHYLPNRLVEEVNFEIGSATEVDVNSFLLYESDTAEFETDMSAIDLSKLGTYNIRIKVHNYLSYDSILNVVDTTKPKVVVKDLNTGYDTKLTPEDFIVKATDNTTLTHSFKQAIDPKKQTQEVIIITKDIAGNSTESKAKLSFYAVLPSINKELGKTNEIKADEFLTSKNKDIKISFKTEQETIDKLPVGENKIILLVDGTEVEATIIVKDTTAPTATPANPTFYKGYVIKIEDFISEYFDLSKVELSYKNGVAPQISKAGNFSQVIVLTDEYGNQTEVTSNYVVEIDEEKPVILGTRDLEIIIGEPYNLRGSAYVRDNVDPNVQLLVDSSKVKLTTEGTYPLIYKAQDRAGNSTQVEVKIKVRKRLPYQPMGDTGSASLNSIADSILSSIINGEMSLYEKTRAIYNFGTTIRYRAGSVTSGYTIDAINTLQARIGNCFGRMHAVEALFDRAGIPNREQIQYKREHSWNQVNIGNGWQNIDSGFSMFLVSHETLKANEYRYMSYIPYLWSIVDPKNDEEVPSVLYINYLEDGSRKELYPQEKREGVLGEQYTTKAVIIPGYKLRFNPTNASGIFNRDATYVNYMYVIDETQKQVDKTALKAAIDKATAMSVDPTNKSSYQNQLKIAIEQASSIYSSYTSTQQMVDGQVSNLNTLMANPLKVANKNSLQAKITEANSYLSTSGKYDADSIARLQTAVNTGNVIMNNVDASQSEVDNQINIIQTAINNLIALDKTALTTVINNANQIDKTLYQKSNVSAFEQAISSANNTLNTALRQAEINNATSSLNTAIQTLTSSTKIDKSVLKSKLALASSIDISLYTAESASHLTLAINQANTVMNAIVNQTEVTSAINQLETAINGLVEKPVVDKTQLLSAINQSSSVDRTLYTAESLVILDSALQNANSVYQNTQVTQTQVDTATNELTSAIQNLVLLPTEPTPAP